MCFFHWEYLDEGLKRDRQGQMSGNAGMIFAKCKNAERHAAVCASKIDALYGNSDTPTRTQTEEAFGKMFAEMIGDLKGMIADDRPGGRRLAALRRRQRDGDGAARADDRDRRPQGDRLRQAAGPRSWCWPRRCSSPGSAASIGALGSKLLCDVVRHRPVHRRVPALLLRPLVDGAAGPGGRRCSIGFVSGLIPAVLAAQLSVVNGLRKVV